MKRNNKKKGPRRGGPLNPIGQDSAQVILPVRGVVSFVSKVRTILGKLYFLKAFGGNEPGISLYSYRRIS